MLKFSVLALLLFGGCYHYPHLHDTPRYRVPIHINSDVPVDQATVDEWVDLRVDEWLTHKVDWGCEGLSDGYLEQLATLVPVIIDSGYFVPGSTDVMGYNHDGSNSRIVVAIDYPALRTWSQYDPDYVTHPAVDDVYYTFGLRELPHEWTHTARGAWHP